MRCIDLFSGIGGFRIGLEQAFPGAIETVAYCDNNEKAVESYRAAFKSESSKFIVDICDATDQSVAIENFMNSVALRNKVAKRVKAHFPKADLVVGGFPCQPHSLMGNRKGSNDNRGSIVYEIVKLIYILKPRNFIFENVRAFKSVNDGKLHKEFLSLLEEFCGYKLKVYELNASDYGVPQVRRRLFICGSIDSLNALPDEAPVWDKKGCGWATTWHLLEKNVEERYYLSERIKKTILKDQHKGYSRPADINKLIARPLTRTMHKMHRASQDNYYSDDFILGRYSKPLSKVRLNEKADAGRIRRITPKEAFRIQSFPEGIIKKIITSGNSDTQLYMQAGNAVPPMMVKNLAKHILSNE